MSDATKEDKDKTLNERIDAFILASDSDYNAWKPVYERGLDYIFNDQLRGKRIKEGWDAIQVNHIFAAVMQELALISQRKPKLVGEPRDENEKQLVEDWIGVARYIFDKTLNMPQLLMDCTLDGKANGHYAVKIYHEPKAEWNLKTKSWFSEIRAVVLKPENILIDPLAESVQDARFVGVRRIVSVEYAKSRYPKFAKEIEKEAETALFDEQNPAAAVYVSRPDALVGQDTTAVKGEYDKGVGSNGASLIRSLIGRTTQSVIESYETDKKKPAVVITELWFRDSEERTVTESVPVPLDELIETGAVVWGAPPPESGLMPVEQYMLAETGEPLTAENWIMVERTYEEPVYPYGRYLIRIGKETILNPKPEEQVWFTPTFPVIIGVNYKLPHTWHGLNAVEIPSGLQDWLNIAYMHLANHVKLNGDPVTIVEKDAIDGASTAEGIANKLKSRAGALWVAVKGGSGRIVRSPAPPLSQAVTELTSSVSSELKNLTGSQDIARGQQMGGRQTAYEVSQLAQSAANRPQLQSNLLDLFTIDVMDYAIELAKATLTPGDMVRVIGEESRQRMKTLQAEHFDVDFDIKLDVTTAMPFNEEQKKAEALQLYQVVGQPFLKRLLDAYDVSNPEELVAAVQQQAMTQMQAAQAPPTT